MITPFIKGLISVQELSICLKQLVKDAFPFVTVYGEISNLRRVGKITYFTLKDEASRISVVTFNALDSSIQEGLSVVVEGRVDVYIVAGSYQIIARTIKHLGLGVLQQKFELLKEKLHAEGLFAADKKLPIPILPKHIGIITSSEAAALQDFLQILKRKKWYGRWTLAPALVQGTAAPRSIEKAFETLSKDPTIDLIILIRGGGSFEDLNCFNDEHLVRVLSHRKKPLLTGIGHEINTTLCDFVADLRAETPTAAAEIVVYQFQRAQESYLQVKAQLNQAAQLLLQHFLQSFAQLQQKFLALNPATAFGIYQEKWLQLQQRMIAAFQYQMHIKCSVFHLQKGSFEHFSCSEALAKKTATLKHLSFRLDTCFNKHWDCYRGRYENAYLQLKLSNPDRLLSCGLIFPIEERTQKIKDVNALEPGKDLCFLHKSGRYKVHVTQNLNEHSVLNR